MGSRIKQNIEEDFEAEHEIKVHSVYKMTTKNYSLFLVVTNLSFTLNYLNKNVRRVLYTRVVWELRKSSKQIIQCHNCQQVWATTSNCGRPVRCLKCAGDHHTRTCIESGETAATCANVQVITPRFIRSASSTWRDLRDSRKGELNPSPRNISQHPLRV